MSVLFFIIMFIIFIGPFILTSFNIINLLKKKNKNKSNNKNIKENIIDILTFVLGITFTILLYKISEFKDYNVPLTLGGMEASVHAPIASWSVPTVITIFSVGIVSYLLIKIKKLNLPPLIIVACMSGIFICSLYMLLFIIQISKNLKNSIEAIYLILLPINYILCSIRAEIEVMNYYKEKNINQKEYKNKFLNKCSIMLNNINNWPILSIIFAIPLIILLICILVLFGQRPDEAIQAFLETSDWTLSKKVSPPPVEYDAHYLCTVSLKGHERLVKPTRMGIRHGEKIVVNRQLCVANAFENLIEEKTPRFHHFIRYVYDKYGFPLSKHINTAWQADITYIFMKPLEWLFLIVLYTLDKRPENRIATQYIGSKLNK